MEIDLFRKEDIPRASVLAKNVWGSQFADETETFNLLMNEYLVRYNYRNEDYAFKLLENGVMVGCLFAAWKSDVNDSREWILRETSGLSASQREVAQICMDYYGDTSVRVSEFLRDEDITLTFFLCERRGGGKLLLNKLMQKCIRDGRSDLYLWTDTSCNHLYYPHNGYTLVSEFRSPYLDGTDEDYRTFIYRKRIK